MKLAISSSTDYLSPIVLLNSAQMLFIETVVDNKDVSDNIANTADHETISVGSTVFEADDGTMTVTSNVDKLKIGARLTITGTAGTNNQTVVIKNIIGTKVYTDATFADETVTPTVVQKAGVIEEYAPVGGTAAAKYQNKPVVLDSQCTGLKMMFSTNIAPSSSFELYYRTGINTVETAPWVKIPVIFREATNFGEYLDHEYSVNSLTSFNAFQVKLVMRTDNSAMYPSFKDLRVIALA
jgi:hypothetical protein